MMDARESLDHQKNPEHAALVLLLGSTVLSEHRADSHGSCDHPASQGFRRGRRGGEGRGGSPPSARGPRPYVAISTWRSPRSPSCDLFIHIGAGLEPWVPDILQAMPRKSLEVLEASRGLQLIGAGPTRSGPVSVNPDPHVWLDFSLDLMIVDKSNRPSGTRSRREGLFAANAESLRRRLRDLDTRFKTVSDDVGRATSSSQDTGPLPTWPGGTG